MNQKTISTQLFDFGSFLETQVLSKVSKQFRQSSIIRLYIETITILFYRLAIDFDSSFANVHCQLGKCLAKKKQWEEAIVCYERAIANDYSNLFDVYYNLGQALQKLEKFEEAIIAFRNSLKIDPKHHWAYIFLGEALSSKGEISEAIEIYQAASQKQIARTHPHVILKQQKKSSLSAPNFLVIGQAKCGTTSLYTYLTQHPQILPPIRREINFWNRESTFSRGLSWYLAHFPSTASKEKLITGEATTTYLDSYKAAQRIFQFFPKMKFIILLRNPVDRVYSHYYMNSHRYGWDNRSLKEAIFSELDLLAQKPKVDLHSQVYATNGFYITRSTYIESVRQWMELFPKEQFLILKSEDLFANPDAIVKQVFQFLGVEPYELQEYRNQNKGDYPPISQLIHDTLSDYFRPFNQQLEEYLDRKFNWNIE